MKFEFYQQLNGVHNLYSLKLYVTSVDATLHGLGHGDDDDDDDADDDDGDVDDVDNDDDDDDDYDEKIAGQGGGESRQNW